MLKKKKNTNNLSKIDADFFEDDFDFEEENKAPSKKNKKNEKDDDISVKGIMLKYVMPSLLALFVGLGVGYSIPKANTTDDANKPINVTEVNGQIPLADVVKSIKDDQIKLLNKQLSSFKKVLVKKTGDNGETSEEEYNAPVEQSQSAEEVKNVVNSTLLYEEVAKMKVIANMYEANLTLFDNFFDKLMAVKRYANDSELDSAKKALSEYVNDPSGTMLYNLLKAKSIQKEVEEDGVKASTPIMSLLGGVPNQSSVYLVKVPFITSANQKTYIAEYIVSVSKDKISYVKYLGYNTLDISSYLKELKESLGVFNLKETKPEDKKEEQPKQENKQEENKQ